MKKKLFTVFYLMLLAFIVFSAVNMEASAKGKSWRYSKKIVETKGAFTYYAYPSKDKKEAWIYRIKVKDRKKCSTLSIPRKIGGKKVTRLGNRNLDRGQWLINIFGIWEEPWHDYDYDEDGYYYYERASGKEYKIKTLIIPDTVEIIQPCTFSSMYSLRTVKMSKKVTAIKEYTFYECVNLKTIDLPVKLKKLDTWAFDRCPKLKTLNLSAKNKTYQIKNKCVIAKKNQSLVYVPPGGKVSHIPDGVKIIKTHALDQISASTVYIPASVKKIEGYAFGKNIENVEVSADNKVFEKDGQCIYNKTDNSLTIAIVDKNHELYVSDKVENLVRNYNIVNSGGVSKLVLPETLKSINAPAICTYAGKVYFTGADMPEIKEAISGYLSLPTSDIYVPEVYSGTYEKWYKENGCYSSVRSWNTYIPEEQEWYKKE